MGTCTNHPDRETNFLCSKHNIYMCEECMACRDPDIYCKFRSSCPVWFMTRKTKGLDEEDVGEEKIDEEKIIENEIKN